MVDLPSPPIELWLIMFPSPEVDSGNRLLIPPSPLALVTQLMTSGSPASITGGLSASDHPNSGLVDSITMPKSRGLNAFEASNSNPYSGENFVNSARVSKLSSLFSNTLDLILFSSLIKFLITSLLNI